MINIDKNIWGPLLWSIMHIAATKYRYNRQTNLYNILFKKYISILIPCNECLKHYNSYINSQFINPIDLEISLYKFHDQVSVRTGKKPNSDYNAYHQEYSRYGLNEILILSNKLKNFYIKTGLNSKVRNVDHFINFIKLNAYLF